MRRYDSLLNAGRPVPVFALLVGAVLLGGLRGARAAEYEPTWESLKRHDPVPEWFENAKFGIYTHWGPYAVPAYDNEWYPRNMYREGSDAYKYHVENFGPPSDFGYRDFIPQFRAQNFDADEWAELFKKAGAQFAGPVAEHHDGFSMWDSEVNRWNAADMGPKRDVVGELAEAVRERGMKFVVSFHHAHNYNYFPKDNPDYDTADPEYGDLYGNMERQKFLNRWKAKLLEVVDSYRPSLVWFDFGLGDIEEEYRREFLAHYFNRAEQWNEHVTVTYKGEDLPDGVGVLDLERKRMEKLTERKWLTDTSIDRRSWGYVQNPDYKDVNTLVDGLVDRVSKNGNLLLNVGPKADGTIPRPVEKRLLAMGRWLMLNGEAIYGTRPWRMAQEGTVRYTRKGDVVYAIALEWPKNELRLAALGQKAESAGVEEVRLLGTDQQMMWERSGEALTIDLPHHRPCDHACAFKIILRR